MATVLYASTLNHLLPADSAVPERGSLPVPMVAGLCLQCLAQRKYLMEDFLADSDLTLAMRRQALEDERANRHHVDALSNFDV